MFENNKMCRTCSLTKNELLPINTVIENEISVVDCFNECMKIEINEGDNLPQVICLTCLDHILEVRKFYLQIINAENYFKQSVQTVDLKPFTTNSITKNESIEHPIKEEFSEIEVLDEVLFEYEISDLQKNQENSIQVKKIDFHCNKCNETFKYEKNFKLHLRLDHEDDDDTISDKDGFKNLDKSVIKESKQKYRCSICDFSFKYRTNFLNHMKRHKSRNEIGCKCPHLGCGQEFYEAESLHQHIKKQHTGKDNSLLCPICGQTFSETKGLKRHMDTHNMKRVREYKCEYCDKTFTGKMSLKSHERSHTGERPYKCSYCEKSFKQSSVLKTHVTLHTGKTVQCPICDKKFSRKGFLAVHMRSHTQERPYVCNICSQSYTQKCHLQSHLNGHTLERQFACDICGMTFFKREVLRGHRFKHSQVKPYKCPQCTLETASSYWFRKHLQRAHNIFDDIRKYKRDVEGILETLKNSQRETKIASEDENVEIMN